MLHNNNKTAYCWTREAAACGIISNKKIASKQKVTAQKDFAKIPLVQKKKKNMNNLHFYNIKLITIRE